MQVNGFGQLLATRVGFAAAQATQNPVCFSLIPELFPKGRTTAMAFYNSAIYMGRALSFAAVIVAAQLGIKHSDLDVQMVCTSYIIMRSAPLQSASSSDTSLQYLIALLGAHQPSHLSPLLQRSPSDIKVSDPNAQKAQLPDLRLRIKPTMLSSQSLAL